jgi:microcompartment protein CcmL/EutN
MAADALGIVETRGLVSAIEAANAMVTSAIPRPHDDVERLMRTSPSKA